MILRPSGGLYYHWRALRHRHLWRPFQTALEGWLANWPCPKNELVLLGPSAGYTLPTAWLRGFSKITAYDLDPLASRLFNWRHSPLEVNFVRRNLFWENRRLSLMPLKSVALSHPDAVFLFCNVLGQVLLEGQASEEEWREYLFELRRLLRDRYWASYHDEFSTHGNTRIDHLTNGEWCAGLPIERFHWQLDKKRRHEVAAVFHNPKMSD